MTIDRLVALIRASSTRNRHKTIVNALTYQYFATEASRHPVRCVPRFRDVAKTFRQNAIDYFDTAVRQGFIDC